jgi:hypothetical protein
LVARFELREFIGAAVVERLEGNSPSPGMPPKSGSCLPATALPEKPPAKPTVPEATLTADLTGASLSSLGLFEKTESHFEQWKVGLEGLVSEFAPRAPSIAALDTVKLVLHEGHSTITGGRTIAVGIPPPYKRASFCDCKRLDFGGISTRPRGG